MYERDLQDLIRGLRSDAAKRDEPKFIAGMIEEIRKEIRSENMDVKGGAVCKLTYLDMLGYDMSWASFHVVEVMSSPYFHIKSGGYLAAAQSFDPNTDVLMLTTNLLKKDMASAVHVDISAALNCLSQVVTPALAQDLSLDLIPMLNHSKPLIRKRAILLLYKMMLQDPDSFDRGLNRLRDKLGDPDIGVVSSTVNVLCELSRREPERCLPLAPHLFDLLTNSSNNWMLIKIVKLFGALTPYEPRLIKKLQPPLTDLINTTPAISLLYECVHTCIIGNMFQGASGSALVRKCISKLAAFLDDSDQNLKYIALLAMVKIVPTHPGLVAEHRRSILSSTSDADISIRMRALDLTSAMVNRYSLQAIVQHLLSQLTSSDAGPSAAAALQQAAAGGSVAGTTLTPAYRLELCKRILEMCSKDFYDNVDDFEWYLSVLVDLSYVAAVDVGREIKAQLLDVAVRVKSVRPFAVKLMAKILGDEFFVEGGGSVDVLWAAAWLVGEFSSDVIDPIGIVTNILRTSSTNLPPDILAVYILSATKLFGWWAATTATAWSPDQLPQVREDVQATLNLASQFTTRGEIEVQERAVNFTQLLTFVSADLTRFTPTSDDDPPKSLHLIHPLSAAYDLNAVAPEAQATVSVPDGLDLDADIIPGGIPDFETPTTKNVKKKVKKKVKADLENIPTLPSHDGQPDVEAIPIVRLDADLLSTANLNIDLAIDRPRSVNRPLVSKDGEMPETPPTQTPPVEVEKAPTPTLVAEGRETPRSTTPVSAVMSPDPVKVQKTKKPKKKTSKAP